MFLSNPEEPTIFRGLYEEPHFLPSYSAIVDSNKYIASTFGNIMLGQIASLSTESNPCIKLDSNSATTFYK